MVLGITPSTKFVYSLRMCQGTFFFIKKERLGQKTSGRKD